MECPPIAYDLTDRIIALYASEEVRQKTMEMQVDEFREWLAMHMTDVLSGHPRLAPPPPLDLPTPTPPEPDAFLTEPPTPPDPEKRIREMLRTAPPEVQKNYAKFREQGMDAMEACEAALTLFAQGQSEGADRPGEES